MSSTLGHAPRPPALTRQSAVPGSDGPRHTQLSSLPTTTTKAASYATRQVDPLPQQPQGSGTNSNLRPFYATHQALSSASSSRTAAAATTTANPPLKSTVVSSRSSIPNALPDGVATAMMVPRSPPKTAPQGASRSGRPNNNNNTLSRKPKATSLQPQGHAQELIALVNSGKPPITRNGVLFSGNPSSGTNNANLPAGSGAAAMQSSSLLPPPSPHQASSLVVVLDLDETILYGREGKFILRPYLKQFLMGLRDCNCEVVVWTAALPEFAAAVVRSLDPTNTFIDHCIPRSGKWFSPGGVKDLRKLGRDLRRVLIIENTPSAVRMTPLNAILVEDYLGSSTLDATLSILRDVVMAMAVCVGAGKCTVTQFCSKCPVLTYRRFDRNDDSPLANPFVVPHNNSNNNTSSVVAPPSSVPIHNGNSSTALTPTTTTTTISHNNNTNNNNSNSTLPPVVTATPMASSETPAPTAVLAHNNNNPPTTTVMTTRGSASSQEGFSLLYCAPVRDKDMGRTDVQTYGGLTYPASTPLLPVAT